LRKTRSKEAANAPALIPRVRCTRRHGRWAVASRRVCTASTACARRADKDRSTRRVRAWTSPSRTP